MTARAQRLPGRTPAAAPHRAPPPSSLRAWFGPPEPWWWALIFVATFIVYAPALHGAFLWDDAGHVTRPDLRSLGGLARIWFEVGATQQYYPLLHSAFWLEHRLWGDAPLGYHLVNALLHATAAGLFAHTLRRLAVPGAWFAALVFALHPICVESVAWISEQKNTLSAVLYFSALLAYLRFDESRRPSRYVIATVFFVLALATKTVTATLPAALLVIFWWRRGRLDWRRDVRPLLLWFALAAAAGAVTAWFEHQLIGAQGDDFALGAAQRLLLAGRAAWFYLGKLLWPAPLVFIYPRWTLDAGAVWQWLFPAAALAVLVCLWRGRTRNRAPLATALFFGGTLFPGLGFINVFPFRYSFVADHFQYLACLGPIAALTAGGTLAARRWPTLATRGLATALVLTLGVLTWRQSHVYTDVFTLYRATLAHNPASWMAHNNLGMALVDAGQPADALPHYEEALRLRPDFAEAENNFGYALAALGRYADAVPHYRRALALQPRYAQAENNLGVALMSLGRSDEGLAAFARALDANPRYAGAHYNLGLALARLDRTGEALPHFEHAAQLQPDHAAAEAGWATALTLTGRFAAARPHFERALQLEPRSVQNHFAYANALASAGFNEDAADQYRAVLQLAPDFAEAHRELARALQRLGRIDEARYHLIKAQRLTNSRR